MAKVAARFGPSWVAVRDQPYEDTLESYLALLDLERLEALEQRQRDLDTFGILHNLGTANVRALQQEVDRHQRRLQRGPRDADADDGFVQQFMDWPGMPNYKRPVS